MAWRHDAVEKIIGSEPFEFWSSCFADGCTELPSHLAFGSLPPVSGDVLHLGAELPNLSFDVRIRFPFHDLGNSDAEYAIIRTYLVYVCDLRLSLIHI